MEKLLLALVILLPGALASLPETFTASSYAVTLAVTADVNTPATGSVVIILTCTAPTSTIVLNWGSSLIPTSPATTDFAITYQAQGAATASSVAVASVTPDTSLNTVNITTTPQTAGTNTFEANGVVTVTVNFRTSINRDNKGLFFRQYPIENNQINTVLMTNLRPTFARDLFPCLDEPSYPATITLVLTHPTSWIASSSLPLTSSTRNDDAGTTTDTFGPARNPLPPNTFVFIIAENMTITPYTVPRSTTTLTFLSRRGLAASARSANIEFLADYFYMVQDVINFDFPLRNLQIVMVPGLEEPFAGYGIIFIREDTYAQDYSNPQMEGLFKARVAPVVYQFIRQFSEFSMRPRTWSDYWISPAIAKFLQYTILNTVMPILDFKSDLEVVARQTVLSLDSKPTARPLQDFSIDAGLSASVEATIKDPLKNLKGAVILSMLDQAFPAGSIFTAIRSLLSASRDALVTSSQFYTAITTAVIGSSGGESASVTAALNRMPWWFNSTRYPVLNVGVSSVGTPGAVSFTSSAYCSVVDPSCSTLPGEYFVSATVGSRSDNRFYTPRQYIWVNTSTVTTTRLNLAASDWVVANMKSGGYYRSNYSVDNWGRIVTALSQRDNQLLGRTQILDDAFALALAPSALNYDTTVAVAMATLGDNLYRDLVPIQRGLREIRDNLMGLPTYSTFRSFATNYFQNLDNYLQNSTTDAFEKARIQALFLDEMCESNAPGYRSSAVSNLTALLTGVLPNTVPSSAYEGLACCGAQYSSTLRAQYLWNIITNSSLNFYSRHFASVALGCLSNYTDISQLYTTMTTTTNIQLKPYILTALQNAADRNPVNFLANITTFAERFQPQLGAASLASLIVRAGRKVNDNTQAAVLNSLATANVDTVVRTAASDTTTAVRQRISWSESNSQTLATTLSRYTPSAASGATVSGVVSLLLLLPSMLFTLTASSLQ